ncbi:hypothetical protein OIV83_003563 [Microbotryomycetes sp. JL201]|nr:hypothetical protein OIV83_003563 [Microbotryomycetes sp. JL201]
MSVYVITGASRGLGFGYVKKLLESGSNVSCVALARSPDTANQLKELKQQYSDRLEIVKHDVSSESSAQEAAKQVEALGIAKNGIDVLINNAGVIDGGFAPVLRPDAVDSLKKELDVNVFGAMYTTQAFLPLLKKGNKKQIIFLSSILGSMGNPMSKSPAAGTYSMTKAAINMYAVKLSAALQDFTVIPFHPGYVKTDMNGGEDGHGQITVEEAISSGAKVFLSIKPEDNLKFLQYTGETLPW